jgi:hypothetical protein
MSMHSICNNATFQKSLSLLPAATYRPGETVQASASRALIELNRHVQEGQPSSVTDKTIGKIEELLGASGGNLAYAGYPYDPYTLEAAKH